MPLKDKIAKASEQENEQQGALVLQESLLASKKSRAWSKHQTHLWKKGNEEELAEFQATSKKEKGQLTCLFLMRQDAGYDCNVQKTVKATNTLEKKEKSEKKAYDEFGDDLEKHVASGRVAWREALGTPSRGQEFEQQDDEIEAWDKQIFKEPWKRERKREGQSKTLQKGGTGTGGEDKKRDEEAGEEQRDLLTSTMSNHEEAFGQGQKQHLGKGGGPRCQLEGYPRCFEDCSAGHDWCKGRSQRAGANHARPPPINLQRIPEAAKKSVEKGEEPTRKHWKKRREPFKKRIGTEEHNLSTRGLDRGREPLKKGVGQRKRAFERGREPLKKEIGTEEHMLTLKEEMWSVSTFEKRPLLPLKPNLCTDSTAVGFF